MTINLSVSENELSLNDYVVVPATGSVGSLKLKFNFSQDDTAWENLPTKQAFFQYVNSPWYYANIDANGVVIVPRQVIAKPAFKIMLRGYDSNGVIVQTNVVEIPCEYSPQIMNSELIPVGTVSNNDGTIVVTQSSDVAYVNMNSAYKEAVDKVINDEFLRNDGGTATGTYNFTYTNDIITIDDKVISKSVANANVYSSMNHEGVKVSNGTTITTYANGSIVNGNATLSLPNTTGTLALVSDITALDADLQGQIDLANTNHVAYVDVVSTLNTATSVRFTIMATNIDDEERSSFDLTIGEATTSQAGLLNSTDKGKINAIANDIATALSTAKTYTDNKVARTNLVSVIGEATQSINGLLSSEDKRRLDTLYALLGETSDADSIVNTINEVLEIFNQYPEGADLVNALSLKINYTDIVDNLTSYDTNKPLSANQGRVLKGQIDNIVNGTTIVGKANMANMDSEGNVIKDTYFNREDGFAVGLVSVTEYDEDTGEVTLEYNSSAVTNIAYDTNTGVITFTY